MVHGICNNFMQSARLVEDLSPAHLWRFALVKDLWCRGMQSGRFAAVPALSSAFNASSNKQLQWQWKSKAICAQVKWQGSTRYFFKAVVLASFYGGNIILTT